MTLNVCSLAGRTSKTRTYGGDYPLSIFAKYLWVNQPWPLAFLKHNNSYNKYYRLHLVLVQFLLLFFSESGSIIWFQGWLPTQLCLQLQLHGNQNCQQDSIAASWGITMYAYRPVSSVWTG